MEKVIDLFEELNSMQYDHDICQYCIDEDCYNCKKLNK